MSGKEREGQGSRGEETIERRARIHERSLMTIQKHMYHPI